MEHTTHAAGWVDQIGESAVAATDAMLRAGDGIQPPTVHVLLDRLDPPYLGI